MCPPRRSRLHLQERLRVVETLLIPEDPARGCGKSEVGDGVQHGNAQSALEAPGQGDLGPGLLVETDTRLVLMVPRWVVVARGSVWEKETCQHPVLDSSSHPQFFSWVQLFPS